jgi:TrmH family RNA methyltransferase
MKNMGLSRLVLVDPGEVGGEEARSQAWQAWDILEGARQEPTLRAAVASASLVVGTSSKAEGWPPRRLAGESARGGSVALVFGPESTGLRREELDLCHEVVRIPASPEQPSLNLAQAVLVVAYEIFVGGLPSPPLLPSAEAGEIESVLDTLQEGLLGIGFLNPQNPEPVLAELRRLLARAAPTPRELQVLRGLARQVAWAAGEIGRSGARKG